jgi:hypothetical protein
MVEKQPQVRKVLLKDYCVELRSESSSSLRKYIDRDMTLHIVMPPWPLEDLLYLRKSCYPGEVKDRYNILGGKVRSIFGTANRRRDGERMKKLILSAMQRVNIPSALRTIGLSQLENGYVGLLFSLYSEKEVEKTDDGRWINRLKQGEIRFATDFIEGKVVEDLLSKELDALRRFLDTGTSIPGIQSLRGRVMENFVHRDVCLRPIRFRTRSLEDSRKDDNDKFFVLPPQSSHHFKSLKDIKPEAYNIPLNPIFAGVDAILPSQGLLFQVTVSNQHPIKAKALELLKPCFKEYLEKPNSIIKLVFVTDSRQFPVFQHQSYHDSNGHVLKTPGGHRIPWIKQWVWEFDIQYSLTGQMNKRGREEDSEDDVEDQPAIKRRSARLARSNISQ